MIYEVSRIVTAIRVFLFVNIITIFKNLKQQ